MTRQHSSRWKRQLFRTKSLALCAAAVMFSSCINDVIQQEEQRVPVRAATARIDGGTRGAWTRAFSDPLSFAPTRATDDLYTSQFDGGETIELYLDNSGNATNSTYTVSTTDHSTLSGGNLYYPSGTEGSVTLYGVYPSGSTSSHTVLYNQTSDANYKASDLMYASTVVNLANKASTQSLSFGHQLIKLKLNIVKDAAVSQVTQVKMKNVKRTVTVTANAADMTPSSTPTTATDGSGDNILIFSGTSTAANTTYAVVFPAQSWNAQDFIEITADGSTATYQLTRSSWTAGCEYELTLNLGLLNLSNTVSITDWNDGSSCTVSPVSSSGGTLEIAPIGNQRYTGSAIETSLTVTCSGSSVSSSDYTATWYNNTNIGTATVVVVGKNSYAQQVGFRSFNIISGDGSISYAATTVNKTYGDAAFTNELAKVGDGTVTYSCSPAGVATVNETTGEVTIVGNGTTTITATVANSANYTYAVNTASYTLNVGTKSITSTATGYTGTYDGNEHTITVSVTDPASGYTVKYGETEGSYTLNSSPTLTTPGTKTVYYQITAENYTTKTGNATITINNANASLTAAPTARTLTYTGSAQALVNAGTASHGTVYYQMTATNNQPANTSGFSSNIPTATTSGTYYVWYYVQGDTYYNSTSIAGPVTVTIKPPYTELSAATSSDVGKVICSNGHIHTTVSAVTCGGTASAMIAYVGSNNNAAGSGAYSSTLNHGLAIALTDVINTSGDKQTAASHNNYMTWANASTACSNYKGAKPSGVTWQLPTAYQWERMLIGCGSSASFISSESSFSTSSNSFGYGNFRTKLTACGSNSEGVYDVQSNYYWSATERSANTSYAWSYSFYLSRFDDYGKAYNYYVRPCFAF